MNIYHKTSIHVAPDEPVPVEVRTFKGATWLEIPMGAGQQLEVFMSPAQLRQLARAILDTVGW